MTRARLAGMHNRRADKCAHDGVRLFGATSQGERTFCQDCGTDITVETDPRLRALIEKVYSTPPATASLIVDSIDKVLGR